jgi:hypothetical protein
MHLSVSESVRESACVSVKDETKRGEAERDEAERGWEERGRSLSLRLEKFQYK